MYMATEGNKRQSKGRRKGMEIFDNCEYICENCIGYMTLAKFKGEEVGFLF